MKSARYLLLLMSLSATGCGETTGDRAASGPEIGAVAVSGAATGGDPLNGALIGGASGGAGGAATSPSQINLGEPVWK